LTAVHQWYAVRVLLGSGENGWLLNPFTVLDIRHRFIGHFINSFIDNFIKQKIEIIST